MIGFNLLIIPYVVYVSTQGSGKSVSVWMQDLNQTWLHPDALSTKFSMWWLIKFGVIHLTLFILIDFPIHIDTISMDLSILYFKGSQVKISQL